MRVTSLRDRSRTPKEVFIPASTKAQAQRAFRQRRSRGAEPCASDAAFEAYFERLCEVIIIFKALHTHFPAFQSEQSRRKRARAKSAGRAAAGKPRQTQGPWERRRAESAPIEASSAKTAARRAPEGRGAVGKDAQRSGRLQSLVGLRRLFLSKAAALRTKADPARLSRALRSKIGGLLRHVRFNFPRRETVHGPPEAFTEKGRAHWLSLESRSEYAGDFRRRRFHGNGKKWVRGSHCVEGFFLRGKLCGFGQKRYVDGSFYR